MTKKEREAVINSYNEIIDWCKAEIKSVERAERRANDNCGAYFQGLALKRLIRSLQIKVKKLGDNLTQLRLD